MNVVILDVNVVILDVNVVVLNVNVVKLQKFFSENKGYLSLSSY